MLEARLCAVLIFVVQGWVSLHASELRVQPGTSYSGLLSYLSSSLVFSFTRVCQSGRKFTDHLDINIFKEEGPYIFVHSNKAKSGTDVTRCWTRKNAQSQYHKASDSPT